MKRREQKRPEGKLIKKIFEQKNLTKSFFQRLPSNSFKSVSRVSRRARETERPKKPQNLETEREKKQQKRAETFLWSKKRDASLSEF